MRIYISLDMEGMPGTWNWEQEKTDRDSVKKAIFSHIKDVLTAITDSEQNTMVEEVVIADSHAAGDNLSYSITDIDKRIKLISGCPRPNYMMPAFDSRFDMVFFLGYHAGYGTEKANMDHTYSNSKIHSILINDKPMSEALINAGYAGAFGVPVTLVTGDLALKKNLTDKSVMPWVQFITTKEAISKFSAINYSSKLVSEQTQSAVKCVLAKHKTFQDKLVRFSTPVRLVIEFKSTSMTDVASLMPCAKRLDGRRIEYVNDDFKIVFETIMALTSLAYTAGN